MLDIHLNTAAALPTFATRTLPSLPALPSWSGNVIIRYGVLAENSCLLGGMVDRVKWIIEHE